MRTFIAREEARQELRPRKARRPVYRHIPLYQRKSANGNR